MKKAVVLLVIILLMGGFAGCEKTSLLNSKKPVTLTMWHNYGGDMQETMDMLIDQFNGTVEKEKGIVINVTAISSSSELSKSLKMIAKGDPGAPEMPDIFTGYPKEAMQFQEQDMLVNLETYLENDLELYVEDFIEEGRLSDGGLYVFPIAKSTEVLYVNQTLFDRFAEAVGVDEESLATFEGLAQLSRQYYQWTDAQTPDIPNDGKQFYTADSWFNYAQVGMEQLGSSIFSEESLSLEGDLYQHVLETIYTPAVEGGVAIYDGYSSDLSKTGDLVCSTGSSAGILFYGDTITHADGTEESVEYSILPYPTFEGGESVALQRGGGLMVSKSDEKHEYAACIFIKWLTESEQNMKFIEKTGYLPVTRKAFEEDMQEHLANLEDTRIHKMLTAVLSMYDRYEFITAPNYRNLDADSEAYESNFKILLKQAREQYILGESISAQMILEELNK